MAILHKRTNTPGYTWLSADLEIGQLGINYADGALYLKKEDFSVIEIGGSAALSFPLLAPDGNITDPSYSFANKSDSGMWLNGTKLTLQGASNPATGGTLELVGGLGILPGAGSTGTQTHGGDVLVRGGMGDTTGGDVILQGGIGGSINGNVNIAPQNGAAALSLRFYEDFASGNNFVALQAPGTMFQSVTWLLPEGPASSFGGQFLTTTTAGQWGWDNVLQNLSEDSTPQLGGNLDVNGQSIVSSGGGDVTIAPDANGNVNIIASGTGNVSMQTQTSGGQLTLSTLEELTLTAPTVLVRTGAGSGGQGLIKFEEAGTGGGAYVALTAPSTVLASRTWFLPQDDPTSVGGQVLTTNTAAELSFTPIPYDLYFNYDLALTLNDVILKFNAARSFDITSTNAQATVETVSDNTLQFTIRKNTVSIGTIDFLASATSGTVSLTVNPTSVAIGDFIDIELTTMAGTAAENVVVTLPGSVT